MQGMMRLTSLGGGGGGLGGWNTALQSSPTLGQSLLFAANAIEEASAKASQVDHGITASPSGRLASETRRLPRHGKRRLGPALSPDHAAYPVPGRAAGRADSRSEPA